MPRSVRQSVHASHGLWQGRPADDGEPQAGYTTGALDLTRPREAETTTERLLIGRHTSVCFCGRGSGPTESVGGGCGVSKKLTSYRRNDQEPVVEGCFN